MHLDLWVGDLSAAHDEVMALGAKLLQAAPDLDTEEGWWCMPTRPVTTARRVIDRERHVYRHRRCVSSRPERRASDQADVALTEEA